MKSLTKAIGKINKKYNGRFGIIGVGSRENSECGKVVVIYVEENNNTLTNRLLKHIERETGDFEMRIEVLEESYYGLVCGCKYRRISFLINLLVLSTICILIISILIFI